MKTSLAITVLFVASAAMPLNAGNEYVLLPLATSVSVGSALESNRSSSSTEAVRILALEDFVRDPQSEDLMPLPAVEMRLSEDFALTALSPEEQERVRILQEAIRTNNFFDLLVHAANRAQRGGRLRELWAFVGNYNTYGDGEPTDTFEDNVFMTHAGNTRFRLSNRIECALLALIVEAMRAQNVDLLARLLLIGTCTGLRDTSSSRSSGSTHAWCGQQDLNGNPFIRPGCLRIANPFEAMINPEDCSTLPLSMYFWAKLLIRSFETCDLGWRHSPYNAIDRILSWKIGVKTSTSSASHETH